MTNVLFICKDNQMHSQIAECICNLFGKKICSCQSAGITINPKPFIFQKMLFDVYQVDFNVHPTLKSVEECGNVDIAVIINEPNYHYNKAQDNIHWNIEDNQIVLSLEECVMNLLHEIKLGAIE